MTWRTVIISKPSRLSQQQHQLLVQQGEEKIVVPIEDLAALVLENPQINLTVQLLSFLVQNGVMVITCDPSHHPNGLLLPFNQYHRAVQIVQMQLQITEPLKKRLWQAIVKGKIENQAHVLIQKTHQDAGTALLAMANQVKSGDPDNREAAAAKMYWKAIFGAEFHREKDAEDFHNSALNYGYAIIRAAIARSVVGKGLNPLFGLHHDNQLNAFNLVDDLIEPFRPMVDLWVILLQSDHTNLNPSVKATLVNVLYQDCEIAGQIRQIHLAIDFMVDSLLRVFKEKETHFLEFPRFKEDPDC